MSAPDPLAQVPARLRGTAVDLAEAAGLLAEAGLPPDLIVGVARAGIADAVARRARSGR